MDTLLAALAASDVAVALRVSRWGYAAANTAHVTSLAALFGAVLALDLRLIVGGDARSASPAMLRWLSGVAAGGLVSALVTGALLFSVRAPEYAALGVFRLKLALIAAGTLHALFVHARGDLLRESLAVRRRVGLVSIACWWGALVCGRLIAFAGD